MAKIGFIGVGNMGGPMAINLLKAGHQLKVYDLSEELAAKVIEQVPPGDDYSRIAATPQEAAQQVEYVISMLPSGKIVEDLYIHQQAILKSINPQTLVIDCSTIAAENAINLAKAAKELGIATLDAPVSGGVGGAVAGTLTFIVGGDSEAYEQAKPILQNMGKNVFHAGGSGAGQTAKICNNMLLAIHMIGTAEALQLGVDNGLDAKVLSQIMLQSSGRNWSLELYNPFPGVMENAPASKDYQGGFQTDLMNKDLGLAIAAGQLNKSALPMGELAKSLYALHGRKGWGKKDFSSIQKLFAREEN